MSTTAKSAGTKTDTHQGSAPANSAKQSNGYSLDELASKSNIAQRTIRFYQAEKLLPKPARDKADGRVARYTDDHLSRLRTIVTLQDRGLKLPAIKSIIEAGHDSTNVDNWLGLDDSLRGSWGGSHPQLLSEEETNERFSGCPNGTKALFEEAQLIEREGRSFLIPNPRLLEIAIKMVENDAPADMVLQAGDILARQFASASQALIELFVSTLDDEPDVDQTLIPMVSALRPLAADGARELFAQQLERGVDQLLTDPKKLRKLLRNSE